jgi:hypothetical protein
MMRRLQNGLATTIRVKKPSSERVLQRENVLLRLR